MRTLFSFLALAALTACSSSDKSWGKWGEDPMQNPEFMEAMMKIATPGPEHVELARMVGSWKVSARAYMTPGSAPVPFEATATTRTELGGRYVVENFSGSMMGQPMEGLLIMGYDNRLERYHSVWRDTWSTEAVHAYGPAPAPGDDLELSGVIRDLLTPEGRAYRHVTRWLDDDHYKFLLYDTAPDGTEWLALEMSYARR